MARILLIEDDDGTADEIGLELRSSGHDVTRVAALEPARTLSAGEPFDLLIPVSYTHLTLPTKA
mgnify:CR=1 FL=1